MKSTRDKLTGGLLWSLLPRAVQIVVSLYTSVLIVRSLGEFDYGTLSMLRTVLAVLVLLLSLGLGQALNRFVPELRIKGQGDEGRALLARVLLVQSLLWVVVSAATLAARPLALASFPSYGDVLVLGVFLCVTEVVAGSLSQYAISSYRARLNALGGAFGSLALAIATAWLFRIGFRIPAVLWGAAIGQALTAILIASALWHRSAASGRAHDLTNVGNFPWRRLMAYALPWVPTNVLNFVIWRQSETVLLGLLRTREEAGYFDIAYKLPQLALEFVPMSLYPLLLAAFSETATVAKERMPEFLSLYFRLLFFVLAPIATLGFLLGDLAVIRLYGENMAPAAPYGQAFFLIFTASFIGTPLSMAIYIAEKVWINLLLSIGYAVVNVGLDLLLIPKLGLLGATLPTAFVTVLIPIVRYVIARRFVPGLRIPWGFIGRAFLAASPALALWPLKGWAATGLWHLAAVAMAGLLVIALGYRLFRVLRPEDRDFLRRSRMPGRELVLRLL